MNMYIVWPVAIGAWLVAGIASFLYLETYALTTGRPTLSRFMWELTANHPWVVIIGFGMICFVAGFLTDHFFGDGFARFLKRLATG